VKDSVGNPHAESVRTLAAAMFRTGVLLGAATAVVCLAVASAVAGWPGLYGAAVGGAVGFVSCLLTIALMRATAPLPVESLFGAVLGGYLLKIFLLLAVAVPLRGVEQLHPVALALTLLAVVLAWAAAEVIAFRRTKLPTIIPAGS
jgi:ATP synthase protein I